VHLTERDIALYVEQTLPEHERERVESHLSDCPACVEQVAALTRLPLIMADTTAPHLDAATRRRAEHLGSKSRTSLLDLLFLSSVARPFRFAVVGFLLVGIGITYLMVGRTPEPERFRSPEVVQPFVKLSPGDGAFVESTTIFRWTAVQHSAAYQLTLFEEGGRQLWSATISDTMASIPPSVALQPGKKYFWRVEALFPDDTKLASPLNVFTFSP